MTNRRRVLWILLIILLGTPVTGLFRMGTVEVVLWLLLLAAWVVAFFTWAKPERHEGSPA